jgi:hypothetical protein
VDNRACQHRQARLNMHVHSEYRFCIIYIPRVFMGHGDAACNIYVYIYAYTHALMLISISISHILCSSIIHCPLSVSVC